MAKKYWFVDPAALLGAAPAVYADDVLTGRYADWRVRRTLCLSSGDRPVGVYPSIKRYFSIRHKSWGYPSKHVGTF